MFLILYEATTGYICYSGAYIGHRGIVLTLRQRIFNHGYHVFMDNCYNSVAHTEELHNNGTHCSGSLRLPRGAPRMLKTMSKTVNHHTTTTTVPHPIAILQYVKYICVELISLIKYHSFAWKTMKWTKKVFLYLVQMMLHNAHVLYVKHTEDQPNMALLQFHEIADMHIAKHISIFRLSCNQTLNFFV